VQAEALLFDGPAGAIEAAWQPAHADAQDGLAAVICHPHPQHGGAMSNKVVTTIARSMQLLGIGSLRFNFRGVGASEGSYDAGRGEAEDLDAAVTWLRQRGAQRIWLAGFSFGAWVSARMATTLAADALISIAPPVQRFDFATFERPEAPWLIVQGDADELVDADAVAAWAASFEAPPELVRMPGVDHFFHGKLTLLRETLLERTGGWR